jgi:DNA-binding NtrC family response regulator
MMKRDVILQDEGLLLPSLRRDGVPIGASADDRGEPPRVAGASNGPDIGRLPELARSAALAAEREAIERALDRFHWNRRQAADLLGVSYKTLLNKMKQCGIAAPAATLNNPGH